MNTDIRKFVHERMNPNSTRQQIYCNVLISDQGREFVNSVKAELFARTGTEHHVTSAYHPQTNGLTERFNQTLQTALVKMVNENQNDWEDHLSAVLFAYRTAQQKATKLSPFEILYCRLVLFICTYVLYT